MVGFGAIVGGTSEALCHLFEFDSDTPEVEPAKSGVGSLSPAHAAKHALSIISRLIMP
jgi:hypothetical protein